MPAIAPHTSYCGICGTAYRTERSCCDCHEATAGPHPLVASTPMWNVWSPSYGDRAKKHAHRAELLVTAEPLTPVVMECGDLERLWKTGVYRGVSPGDRGVPYLRADVTDLAAAGEYALLLQWMQRQADVPPRLLAFFRGEGLSWPPQGALLESPWLGISLLLYLNGGGESTCVAKLLESGPHPPYLTLLLLKWGGRHDPPGTLTSYHEKLLARLAMVAPSLASERLFEVQGQRPEAGRLLFNNTLVSVHRPWRWASLAMRLFNDAGRVQEVLAQMVAHGGEAVVGAASVAFNVLFDPTLGKALLTPLRDSLDVPVILDGAELLTHHEECHALIRALLERVAVSPHSTHAHFVRCVRIAETISLQEWAATLRENMILHAKATAELLPWAIFLTESGDGTRANALFEQAVSSAAGALDFRELAVASAKMGRGGVASWLEKAYAMSDDLGEIISLINVWARYGADRSRAFEIARWAVAQLSTSREALKLLQELHRVGESPGGGLWREVEARLHEAATDYYELENILIFAMNSPLHICKEDIVKRCAVAVASPHELTSGVQVFMGAGDRGGAMQFLAHVIRTSGGFELARAILEAYEELGAVSERREAFRQAEARAATPEQWAVVAQWRAYLGATD